MKKFKPNPQTVRSSGLIDCPECEAIGACRLSYRGTWNLDEAEMGEDSDGDSSIICSISIYGLRASYECHSCGHSSVKNIELGGGDNDD